MQAYLFFGPPGSGKGTQKEKLESVLQKQNKSMVVIETGQLLRDFVGEKDTLVKQLLANIMEEGGLVPSAFPISTWIQKLTEEKEYEHIIVDGAGRKLAEAKILIELLHFFPDPNIHIAYLAVPDDEVMKRLLLRGREDDKEGIIRNRLYLYKDNETGTTASINFLRDNEDVLFHEIDGVGTIEEVHQRVCEKIGV